MTDQDARDLIANLQSENEWLMRSAKANADALDRLLRERAWQPIETAPKDGTPIIGRLPLDGQIVSVRYWTPEKIAAEEGGHPDEYCGGWYSTSDSSDEYLPKHWIPSPPSPSTIEGEEE